MAYDFDILIGDDISMESMLAGLIAHTECIIKTIDLLECDAQCFEPNDVPTCDKWARTLGAITTIRQAICYLASEENKIYEIIAKQAACS